MAVRLSQEDFAELVDRAVASLPAEFEKYMENVEVVVRARPTRSMLAAMKVPRDSTLLGLYRGVPLTKKSVTAPWGYPEQILIFQRNVEAICESRDQIVAQVRRTVLHEVGHHFGLGEAELERLGYG